MADTEIPSWEQLDGMVDTDPIGLRDLAWRMARALTDRPTIAPDAREKLARHLYANHDVRIPPWERISPVAQEHWLRLADKLLAVITETKEADVAAARKDA